MDSGIDDTKASSDRGPEEDARRVEAGAFFAGVSRADSEAARVGRPTSGEESERGVWVDIRRLLRVKAGMNVLDIGCGCGFTARRWIALATSGDVKVTLLDIPEVISRLRTEIDPEDLTPHATLVEGFFPAPRLVETLGRSSGFAAIVVYSLLHYTDRPGALIEAAVDLLAPGGRLLVGDIPNLDRKGRFLASAAGRAFEAAYRGVPLEEVPCYATPGEFVDEALKGGAAPLMDDLICGWVMDYRRRGYDAFVLEQPPQLPFCHTREDLLIRRPRA